jgi:hypothetical protein
MNNDGPHQSVGYERSDVSPRFAAWTGLGLMATAVLVVAGAAGLILAYDRDYHAPYPRSALERAPFTPPQPRLQTDPGADAGAYRAQADHVLNSYGWVDRQHGIARIPIAEAMRRLAVQGWPSASADVGTIPSPASIVKRTAP